MSGRDVILFWATWGPIGAAAITVFVVIAWKTGALATVRDEKGEIRSRLRITGVLTALGAILLQMAVLITADIRGIQVPLAELGFLRLWSLNYVVYLFWLLYDTLVIDILIVVVWHPAFLELPDAEAHGSVAYHLRTIPKGMIFGIVVTAIATGIVWIVAR